MGHWNALSNLPQFTGALKYAVIWYEWRDSYADPVLNQLIKILIYGLHTHLTRNIIFSLFRILPRERDFTLLWVDALCINKSGYE